MVNFKPLEDEIQYRTTLTQIMKFKKSIKDAVDNRDKYMKEGNIDARLYQANLDGMESVLGVLIEEANDFERRTGRSHTSR